MYVFKLPVLFFVLPPTLYIHTAITWCDEALLLYDNYVLWKVGKITFK